MKHVVLSWVLLLAVLGVQAQHTLRLSIKTKEENQPLPGATITINPSAQTVQADSLGFAVFNNLSAGNYQVVVSFAGLEEQGVSVTVPRPANSVLDILLSPGEETGEEVVVMATRSSRTIRDLPTRVEVISGEELAEKANMKPGDIRMLLSESTGIQTQQTSATSYNSSIRIQGLDGRYTQILRDGFPLYAGFAGGLSLMQVAPLDLRQIEVVKGSASTLYGAGAIAGLVNLVSKTPTEQREISLLANGTSAGGTDLSGFYSQRFKKAGITVFGSRNTGRAYDPAGIGLTAIPKFERYTINPRLFLYGKRTTANMGFSYITEDRTGGKMNVIRHRTPGYFEQNNTDRFTTQAQVIHRLTEKAQLALKNSYTRFNRSIEIPGYAFSGVQQSSYSEATYSRNGQRADWVIGLNYLTDDFNENRQAAVALRNYHYNTTGLFIQNTWSPSTLVTLESGLRGDYVPQYGMEWLPRLSAMFRLTPKFTARVGGGMGYKTPTVFNEESEKTQFQGIRPLDEQQVRNERSAGGNVDVNFRTHLGAVGLSINQLFFYTRLNRPLVLQAAAGGQLQFLNAAGHLDTRGLETNLRFTYHDLKLFMGYTYADVNTHFNAVKNWLPLTARHRLNNVLMYEQEGKFKLGLEGYYVSPQQLSDGARGRAYWTFGVMGEKSWKHVSLFINFENITDTRQTRFDTIFTGSIDNPVFRDIYAPVDGFVMNGGVKLRW